MSKYDFMNEVAACLSERTEISGCRVTGRRIYRNNDTVCHGITISRGGENISPVFYIDRYYDGYCRKKYTVEETADQIVRTLRLMEPEKDGLAEISLDYESCRDRIVYRLISASRNQQYLKDIPTLSFLDLAIQFVISLDQNGEDIRSVRINQDILDQWGTDTRELLETARVNTPLLFPPRLQKLSSVMADFMHVTEETFCENDLDIPLLLLSNEQLAFGATSLLYEDVVYGIAEQLDQDFYVIPSSIHEVLIIPESYVSSPEELNSMISEINRSHVAGTDVLSDRAYYFKKNEKRFYF